MAESKQKNVVQLHAGQSPEQIDNMYLAGMRVALMDGGLPDGELDRLKSAVRQTFLRHNDPIGLMLRLRPGTVREAKDFQYVLLEDFTQESASQWISRQEDSFDGLCIAKVSGSAEGWETVADGILTGDADVALQAREKGMLVLTDDPDVKADAMLWYAETPAEVIAAWEEDDRWDEKYLLDRCAHADAGTLLGAMAVLSALRTGAKAILIFTTDGKNLSAVSSLYPPVPIIAIAKRPEKERMLLCQTMRWATLPTAITRTPESMDVEAFARFVAELYGYSSGDAFVAAGHWVEGENPRQLCCFTL